MRLFAACCVLCDTRVTGAVSLCRPCLHDLPRLKSTCYQCGLPLENRQEASLCGQCQHASPPIDYLMSSLQYAYPVNYLLSQLKFKRDLTQAKIFSHIMLTTLQKHYSGQTMALPDIIIPIPLHKKRCRQRGFNQALEIAKPIAKKLNIPLSTNTVQRVKYTQAQSLLSAVKRRKNLHRSFTINKRMTAEHIVLVDDVVTTGTTVYELATLLKQSGVKKVGVWAVARAVNKKDR